MIALLLVALLQQPAPPDVNTSVDRDHLTVGEELTFTVRASGNSADPVEIGLPPIKGLELVARAEQTEVSPGARVARVVVIALRLRATQPGTFRLGPIQVRQGTSYVQADAPTVTVESNPGSGLAAGLNPRVRGILEHAPPPRLDGGAGLSVVLSSDAVTVGEQVDLLTVAWIPRRLRLEMRRPPTLDPPQVQGVWSYPQPAPSGISASRLLGGEWYDLFAVHQLIFPISPGAVTITPATLHYSVPVAFQFFSQEENHTVTTDARRLQVRDTPSPPPAEFTGAVARSLVATREFSPDTVKVGDPVRFTVTLRGEGNVALWPAPPLLWPVGVRVYPDQVDDHTGLTDGRLTGEKKFHYLVVPDSSGRLIVPPLHYGFFNPASAVYEVAVAAGQVLPVQPGSEAALARVSPPPLLPGNSLPAAWQAMHRTPLWAFALLLLVPPLLAVLRVRLSHRPHAAVMSAAQADGLPAAERRLLDALAPLVADPAELDGLALGRALRAAGVTEGDLAEIVSLREGLQYARFGGVGELKRHALVEQAAKLTTRLRGEGTASRRRPGLLPLVPILLLMVPVHLRAQAPKPEELYEAGALRAAALGFVARTEQQPASAANWYNLGATWFRLGDDANASAAWRRGLRIAPRSRQLRQAIQLVAPPTDGSDRWLSVPPVTVEELTGLALLCWILGWCGAAVQRRIRSRWLILAGVGVACAVTALVQQRRQSQPVGMIVADGDVTLSPSERAPAVATATRGNAVRITRQAGGWLLIEDAAGHTGWLPAARVVRL
ncbi:MAG: BatD family protein [Gemmatimonadota bacterium]